MKVTNSTTSKLFNETNNKFYDEEIYNQNEEIHLLKRRIKDFSFYSTLKSIGLTEENVSIEEIANRMPTNSFFIYHKHGENNPIFPQRTGLLIVIKGLDNSRVKFTFSNFDNVWYGFYDSIRGAGLEKWSGWKSSGDGNIVTNPEKVGLPLAFKWFISGGVDASSSKKFSDLPDGMNSENETSFSSTYLKTKVLEAPSGFSLTLKSSIDPKTNESINLGWSEKRFKQICCKEGYFDTIVVKNPISVINTRRNMKIEENIVGQNYYDVELNKPLWWNGKKWCDALGNEVK